MYFISLRHFVQTVTKIINTSFMYELLPANMKHAVISSLLKNSGLDIMKNCWPILNLSFISMSLARHATTLYFVRSLITVICLLLSKCVHIPHWNTGALLQKLEIRKYVTLVLVDLIAPFDTVDHLIAPS